ncbi:MAG: methylated-DNA--[protein]-cysteine S-methyltransferase [Gammaproteobacteria bacterium]|nr:methylated-DNA--[protein]-cysteine S-methyltransferase [Gammaproteobacteria bacterium]
MQSELIGELKNYFSGKGPGAYDFTLVPTPQGSDFYTKCWNACRKIKPGTTISYGELAKRAGNAKAVRAAGGAMRSGEDALILGGVRNATIRMRSNGRLMWLTNRAFHTHLVSPLVKWSSALTPHANVVEANARFEPRIALRAWSGDRPLIVSGEPRLRALWAFVAARLGIDAAALLHDPDQAGTVRSLAQVRSAAIESPRSTDKG